MENQYGIKKNVYRKIKLIILLDKTDTTFTYQKERWMNLNYRNCRMRFFPFFFFAIVSCTEQMDIEDFLESF